VSANGISVYDASVTVRSHVLFIAPATVRATLALHNSAYAPNIKSVSAECPRDIIWGRCRGHCTQTLLPVGPNEREGTEPSWGC